MIDHGASGTCLPGAAVVTRDRAAATFMLGWVATVVAQPGAALAQECPPYKPAAQIGTLLGSAVDEASGLVASRDHADILWTHNDDANDNRVFALRTDGTVVGTYVVGSGTQDPEDIAIGPGPQAGIDYLFVGDIGDNNNTRSTIVVRRVPEPVVSADQNPVFETLSGVASIRLAYPTGATAPPHKDAETLLVDPVNGDIYVITKRAGPGLVYWAPAPHSTTTTTVMTQVAVLPWNEPVGGDVSTDGSAIIVRRYSGQNPKASIWFRAAGTPLWDAFSTPRCDVALQPEPQGEAVCFGPDSLDYYTVSENQSPGAQIPVWFFGVSGPQCVNDSDCADNLFCNGVETCSAQQCVPGAAACAGLLCNEVLDQCVECLTSADCSDGLFCNGTEQCLAGSCSAGTPPCAGGMCSESNDQCGCAVPIECLAACADQDGDGVRDDACVWWEYADGSCQSTEIMFGDVGGAFGDCRPDNAADNHDIKHVLNCFSGLDSGIPNTSYRCEFDAPVAFNVDPGGPFDSCMPDGVCDGNDVFHVIEAFDNSTTCQCPSVPQPVAQAGPVKTRRVQLKILPHKRTMAAGEMIEVTVVYDGPGIDLKGYQLHLGMRGGDHAGTFAVQDIASPRDFDAVADRVSRIEAFNPRMWQMLMIFPAGAQSLAAGDVMARLTLEASADARGAFELTCLSEARDHSHRTFLFTEEKGVRLAVDVTPARINVGTEARGRTGDERRGE